MSTGNELISPEEYNHYIRSHFGFSRRFRYKTSIEFTPEDKQRIVGFIPHQVLIFINILTGEEIAVAPLLTPSEIGELHTQLLDNHRSINKFFYSSDTSANPSGNPEDKNTPINNIQILCVNTKKHTIKLHCDERSQTAPCRTEADITTTYPDLCGGQTVTRTSYGKNASADIGEQISAPLTAMAGERFVEITEAQWQASMRTDSGTRFMNPENLSLLRTLNAANGHPFSMDSVFRLNPEKAYFYLVGILLSDLSGFEHQHCLRSERISILPEQGIDDNIRDSCTVLEEKGILAYPYWQGYASEIPEIGRAFYDPNTERTILVLAPGYDTIDETRKAALDDRIREQYDIVIKTDMGSDFSNGISSRLKDLGFAVTDMAELVSLMFEETPAEAQPLRRRTDSTAQAPSYLTFGAAQIGGDEGMSTPAQQSPARASKLWMESPQTPSAAAAAAGPAPTPARALLSPSCGSPRKAVAQTPAIIEKAQTSLAYLNERLTAEDYYESLQGLFLLNKYTIQQIDQSPQAENLDESFTSTHRVMETSRTLKHTQTNDLLVIHKPLSFEEAKRDLHRRLTEHSKQIYLIQDAQKRLTILYFNGQSTHLFSPQVNTKAQPWVNLEENELRIGEQHINTIAVPCENNCSLEHRVFHRLHEKLHEDSVVSTNPTPHESLDAVKAYLNFSVMHAPLPIVTEAGKKTELYSLAVKTIPSAEKESAMVAAYRNIVTHCYEMGMTLISRIVDEEYHDLAFIFQQIGSNQYFIIKHPTHPTVLPKERLKQKVAAALERLALPVENIEALAFQDDLPSYPKIAELEQGEKTRLTQHNIKTIYDAPNNPHPETRASLHFKQLLADYLEKGYFLVKTLTGRYDFQDARGVKQTTEYTQAVIFKDFRTNTHYTISHPHHPHTVSKEQLDRAVQEKLRREPITGAIFEPTRDFKDDRGIPKHIVTVTRREGPVIIKGRHHRREHDDTSAQERVVKNVMAYMGFQKTTERELHKAPYKLILRDKSYINQKSFWQKTKEHFSRHKGKYLALLGVIGSGVIAGLTFGAGLIPLVITGACTLVATGTMTIGGAALTIEDYRETTRSARITEGVRQAYSSSRSMIEKLTTNISSPLPRPSHRTEETPAPAVAAAQRDAITGTSRRLAYTGDTVPDLNESRERSFSLGSNSSA